MVSTTLRKQHLIARGNATLHNDAGMNMDDGWPQISSLNERDRLSYTLEGPPRFNQLMSDICGIGDRDTGGSLSPCAASLE